MRVRSVQRIVQRFGESKIDDFDDQSFIGGSDHDIARLEIAVDHPSLMGMADSLTELFENVETSLEIRILLFEPLVEGLPLDELHGEVGLFLLGDAGIDDAADGWVIHFGEGIHLGIEAGEDFACTHAETDDLDGNGAFKTFNLTAAIDFPKASFSDEGLNVVSLNLHSG